MALVRRARPRRRLPIVVSAALLLLVSCGPGEPVGPAAPPTLAPEAASSPADVASSPASPTPVAPRDGERAPIPLPPLPEQGIALSGPRSVVLIDLSGRPIVWIRGFEVWNSNPATSTIALRGRGGVWILRPAAHVLRPVADDRLAAFSDPRHPGRFGLRRPVGSRVDGMVVGHWRFALQSPDGTQLLAQWSGECEVPIAFFARPGGGRPIAVTGEPGLAGAPESFALGWSVEGRAVVSLPVGACGGTFATPGLYLFDGPGDGALLRALPRSRLAAMWGTA